MSELTLVTVQTKFVTPYDTELFARRIVGITLPQSPTITEYGYQATGHEVEESFRPLVSQTGDGVAEFFDRTRAVSPEQRPDYDCHTFVWFALGKVAHVRHAEQYKNGEIRPTSPEALAAGLPYALQTISGTLNHSLLGADNPSESLSVLGGSSPLAIVNNYDLLKLYDGLTIRQIKPLPSH